MQPSGKWSVKVDDLNKNTNKYSYERKYHRASPVLHPEIWSTGRGSME